MGEAEEELGTTFQRPGSARFSAGSSASLVAGQRMGLTLNMGDDEGIGDAVRKGAAGTLDGFVKVFVFTSIILLFFMSSFLLFRQPQ